MIGAGETVGRSGLTIRVSKSLYLFILMIVSVNFFHLSPISGFTTNDVCLAMYLVWLLVGHFLFRPPSEYATVTVKRYYWTIAFIWLGIFISFFAARVLFGQTFVQSLVASRVMLSTLALPVLGIMRPKLVEMERAIVAFSIVLLTFALLDAIGIPIIDRSFFLSDEKPGKELIDEDSFVILLPGFQWVAVSLFFYLCRLRKRITSRNLLGCMFFMSAVYLLQNRTMLFACVVAFAFTMFIIKGENRRQTYIFRVSSVLLIVAAIGITLPQWMKLVTETTTQLGSDNYNRILAFNYFLFEACPSFIYYFTGTGFISANASSIMKDLMDSGIYNSDVGFIGMWNYYGILTIAAIALVVIKGLFKKESSFVRYNALLILIGSLTIACFDTMDKIFWLCFFIYIVYDLPLFKRKKQAVMVTDTD